VKDNKDIIIGEISNAISKTLGKSAGAVMRKAGMAASYRIWPELPSDKSPMEAGKLMAAAVDELGGFGHFAIVGVEGSVSKIAFEKCAFAGLTAESGKPCGEQAICYFGFGLVEETFRRLTGVVGKVELVKRDDGCETCHETITPRG
jgi:hypothetical protein